MPVGVQGLRDGWYAYRVAGVDIFGRISEYSQPFRKQALDTTPPPPPMLVEAKALQARPADVPKSILDNMLTKADQDWLAQNPAGGIRVNWLWPGGARRLAPDAAEFHIYFQPGRMNTIVGRAITVAPDGPIRSRFTTDQTTSLPKDVLKDEWVRVGVNAFKVISNESDTNSNLVITVENLRDPKHSLDTAVSEWIAPVPAVFSLNLTPAMDGYVNYGDPSAWASSLQVIPIGALEAPAGMITQAIPAPENTYKLRTTAELVDPTDRTAPGVLICGGQLFQATEHTTGQNIEITVSAIGDAPNPVVPGQGQSFVYYPSYEYEIIVPGLPPTLAPSEAEPVAYGQIGITAVDTNKNKGPVSPPYTVFAVKRERPPAPPNPPPEPEKVFAEPADYYGQSRYTLSWPRAGNDTYLCYQVYRAVDSSLFAVDAKARDRSKIGTQHPIPDYVEAAAWPFVVDEINKLDNGVLKYDQLRRDSLQVLASQKGNEAAFTLITLQSLDPADPHFQGANDTMHFTDVLPGQATNCYFYRVAVVDRAGNRSDMAASSPPIYIPDTTPPRAPQPSKILGGERQVLLEWQPNLEPGIDRYLIYRTTDPAKAEDIRLMGEPVATKVHPTTDHQDTGLVGPLTYYYRLVAVRKGEVGPKEGDVEDLVSQPSKILAVRTYDFTPPEPPTWVRAEWVLIDASGNEHPWGTVSPAGQVYTAAVALQWISQIPYVRWLVQREVEGTERWRTVLPWLDATSGSGNLVDRSASNDTAYQYRVLGEDKTGKINVKYNNKIVTKP